MREGKPLAGAEWERCGETRSAASAQWAKPSQARTADAIAPGSSAIAKMAETPKA